jgi:hypothetical protein
MLYRNIDSVHLNLIILLAVTKCQQNMHKGQYVFTQRSNLSKANEIREVRIFEDFANLMIEEAREKRSGSCDFFIDGDVYAFDSSTIPLCLNTFWWTRLHHGKGGVKLHTLRQ